MFPEPTELLLISCLTGFILILKIQIKYIDTKNQLAVMLTKGEISHVMSGTIFCVCSTLAISAPSTSAKRCRKEHKKM